LKDFQRARTADYINAETNPEAQMASFSLYLEDRGPVTLRKVLQGTHVAFDVARGVMDSA
jgi:hypothetical protein